MEYWNIVLNIPLSIVPIYGWVNNYKVASILYLVLDCLGAVIAGWPEIHAIFYALRYVLYLKQKIKAIIWYETLVTPISCVCRSG